MALPFKKLDEDFNLLFSKCSAFNNGSAIKDLDSESFTKITSCIYKVYDNLMSNVLTAVNDDSQNGQTRENNVLPVCDLTDEDKTKYGFNVLDLNNLEALEELKEKDDAYLLTSLTLLGSLADATKEDGIAYNHLKELVKEILNNEAKILNNKVNASLALLAINTIVSAHRDKLMSNLFEKRAKEISSRNEKMTNLLPKMLENVKNPPIDVQSNGDLAVVDKKTGGAVKMSGGTIFIGGAPYKPRSSLNGGGRKKKRSSSPKKRKRSSSPKKKGKRRRSRSKSK